MTNPEVSYPAESPRIKWPDDPEILLFLHEKLEEYQQSVTEAGDDDKSEQQVLVDSLEIGDKVVLDALLKIRLIKELQASKDGEVATRDFARRMEEDPLFEPARLKDLDAFRNRIGDVCGVMIAYCTGDTSHLIREPRFEE